MQDMQPYRLSILDTISSDDKRVWNADLAAHEQQKNQFKIHTSTGVTAISKETWETLGEPDLQSPSKLLYSPAKKPLKTTGYPFPQG